jgi:hypothetical protein
MGALFQDRLAELTVGRNMILTLTEESVKIQDSRVNIQSSQSIRRIPE